MEGYVKSVLSFNTSQRSRQIHQVKISEIKETRYEKYQIIACRTMLYEQSSILHWTIFLKFKIIRFGSCEDDLSDKRATSSFHN